MSTGAAGTAAPAARARGVGGIALLRDVPRTATVRARDGVVLPALDRDSFLQAVGSQAPAARAAHRIADERTPRT